jgi:hypothetical protein
VMKALILTMCDMFPPAAFSVRSMLSKVARASAPIPPETTLPSSPKPTFPATWISRPGPELVTASLKPEAGLVVRRSMVICAFSFSLRGDWIGAAGYCKPITRYATIGAQPDPRKPAPVSAGAPHQ